MAKKAGSKGVELGIEVDEPATKLENYQEKPSVYWEGKNLVIRASALGACLGSLVREGMGQTPEPPPDFLQRRFDQGSAAEDEILASLKGLNWFVWDEAELVAKFGKLHAGQARAELKVGKHIIIRQHFDGFARDSTDSEYMVEAKLFGPAYMQKFQKQGIGAFPFYKYQVSIGMHATGMPCLFVTALRDDDGNIIDLFTEAITEPPMTLGEVKLRAMKVYNGVKDGKIPECDWAMYPCGFYQDHDTKVGIHAKIDGLSVSVLGLEEAEFDEQVTNYHAGHEMEKRGKELKDAAKKIMWEWFGDMTDSVQSELVKATPVIQDKAGAVDWKQAAKDAGVDVDDKEVEAKYRKPGYVVKWFNTQLVDQGE